MKVAIISLLLFQAVLLSATLTQAETRYVADQLVVTVRSNTGDNYQVLEKLKTDTAVEVLKTDGPFVQVKTAKGTIGYIRKQFISKETPKPIQIDELKQQVVELQSQLDKERLKHQDNNQLVNTNQDKVGSLTQKLQQTQLKLEKVSSEYKNLRESSKDVIELKAAYDQQNEENDRISEKLNILQEENKKFHRSNMIKWFLAGGAVFFIGWLAGKVSRRKRGFSRL